MTLKTVILAIAALVIFYVSSFLVDKGVPFWIVLCGWVIVAGIYLRRK